MSKDEIVLRKLYEAGEWISTKKLDAIFLEVWGDKQNAGMHCNSLMHRGFIDYAGDGEWRTDIEKEDFDES